MEDIAKLFETHCNIIDDTTKKNNGKRESVTLKILKKMINNEIKFKRSFNNMFGKKLIRIKKIENDKKKGYDLLGIIEGEKEVKIEVKSCKKKKNLLKTKYPWSIAVQFLNGSTGWKIRDKFAKLWYDNKIGNNYLKDKYNLESEIPTFDVWKKKDASMGSAKTKFGKELKTKINRKKECKSFVEFFKTQITNQDIQELKQQCKEIINKKLNIKDYWLNISGHLKNFNYRWWNKVTLDEDEFDEIKIVDKSKNLVFKSKNIEIRIRWQNGNGIANISVQCK